MRKGLLIVICLSWVVTEAQIRVCETCEIQDLVTAVDRASAHDTIIVEAGVYPVHNLVISKPLTLSGREMPILDGENKGYILKMVADSISFSGFHIRNVGISHTEDYAAIYSFKAHHLNISHNLLENVFFGIKLEKSSDLLVENNKVFGRFSREFDSGNGIHLWHCQNARVIGNELSGLRDGIYFEFVDESLVANNDSYQNTRYGLHYMFSNNDEYRGNKFHHNGAGVAVMFSRNIDMSHNEFYDNWGPTSYGLLLKEIYDARIENNKFYGNTVAVSVDGSSRIEYSHNDFKQNGWAVKVTGGCYENLFTANNFISNAFDVSYNSKMNDNVFEGNYWNSYSGYDLNRDGIGDVPYRPVKLFSYVTNRTPETIVLLRSFFVDIINFSERVTPVFTPDYLVDRQPKIKRIEW